MDFNYLNTEHEFDLKYAGHEDVYYLLEDPPYNICSSWADENTGHEKLISDDQMEMM